MSHIKPNTMQFYEAVLSQIPGYVVITDLEHKNIFVNQRAIEIFGYNNLDECIGHGAEDLRCPAAECAPEFNKQYDSVLKDQYEMTLFGMSTYAQQQTKLLFVKKKPFYLNDECVGSSCIFTEINNDSLSKVCGVISDLDKKYRSKNESHQRSYQVTTHMNAQHLTERERECLFYLIRGYTAKMIAQTLSLSPRTVESYLNNAKSKLGCLRKSELIDKSIDIGLINYIPKHLFGVNFSTIID